MDRRIKNVIFDLDGTLLDTSEGIIESVKYTIGILGLKELSEETLLSFVGPPIQMSFQKNYGMDAGSSQEAAEIFRDYYCNKALFKAVPYDGIYEVCERFMKKEIIMAVATYKREDYALNLLNHFGFRKYCKSMHGADNNNKLKKEDVIDLCMREINASLNNTVMVGDTLHDQKGALNVGIPFVAVTYGFGVRSELVNCNPLIVAETPKDIIRILDYV